MINKYFALTLIAATVAVAGCSSDDDDDDVVVDPTNPEPEYVSPAATVGVGGSVYDFIATSDQHTSLLAAIDAAGLADTLDDETLEFTVFAPDDAAFAALNTEETPTAVTDLLADPDALTRVLQYHVVAGTTTSADITAALEGATEEAPATLATLIENESLTLSSSATSNVGVAVNDVDVLAVDLTPEVAEGEATVGVVHSLGAVLTAPEEVIEPVDPGTEEPTEPGTEEPTTPPAGGTGPVTTALAASNSAFLDAFTNTFGAQKLDALTDADPWTVFAPTEVAADVDVRNYLITGSALTAQELIDMGTSPTFGGTTLTFGGTADALTIDGLPATVVGDGTTATVTYSVEGAL